MNMDINVLSKDNFYVSYFTTTEIGNLTVYTSNHLSAVISNIIDTYIPSSENFLRWRWGNRTVPCGYVLCSTVNV